MQWSTIREILEENLSQHPNNEVDTKYRVIDRILPALGYSYLEISPNRYDGNGDIPDYTILNEPDERWYLEAKAWGIELTANAVNQATVYVFKQSARWAVLSNGRQWRLYDCNVPDIEKRLVLSWDLIPDALPDEAPQLFEAISHESICSGRIEQIVLTERHNKQDLLTERLARTLDETLASPVSPVVGAIKRALKESSELDVPGDMIVAYFTGRQPIPVTVPMRPATLPKANPLTGTPLTQLRPTGTKPVAVIMPDGSRVEVRQWKELSHQVLNWIAAHQELPPLPYQASKGKTFFLNADPLHNNGPMRSPVNIDNCGKTVYMEAHGSASDLINNLSALSKAVGCSADQFRVELREP